jgi:hypothetical protein
MSNDAKFGLIVGMGLVVAVALVFFRKDLLTAPNSSGKAISAAVSGTPAPQKR